jgi:acylphosphatase
MIQEIECNITGRVQLVMFRDFSKRMAKRFSVSGFAKNLNNGSLKVVAQGEKEQLEKYIKLLKKGPILAKVDDIKIVWKKPTEDFNGFKILY